jgi:UbiD family decarboxylase
VKDLRSFLAEFEADVLRVEPPTRVRYEVTALQHRLSCAGRFPIVLVERPVLADGRRSPFRAVTNLTASRELVARVLGLSSHRAAAQEIASLSDRRLDPVLIERAAAPVKEVVCEGEDLGLDTLPIFTQHDCDPGPYLTAAHATTYDPDTGADNTAIQRVWAKPGREWPYYPYPASHNRANIEKFWRRGQAAPIAFWIGHHPAVSIGAQAKLGYPESHWGAAGALAGEPVRLVPSDLHGERILVPADAEIVLEGHVPKDRLEAEGPFGEFTGYAGERTLSPVFVVERVTRREDALYHDHGSGLPDALTPTFMMMEAALLQAGRGITPEVRSVHLPLAARRFLAVAQVGPIDAEIARALLRALLGVRSVKTVVLVDEDIDIFDAESVEWAVATRVQPGRDTMIVSGLPGSTLDPSLPAGESRTGKLGIDATWSGGRRSPANRVPEDVWRRVRLADFGRATNEPG